MKMNLIKSIVKKGISIKNRLGKDKRAKAAEYQAKTLRKLLFKAQNTEFGLKYRFAEILNSENPFEEFQKNVPLNDYSSMSTWWEQALQGKESVTWPGKVKYFALSSGTSEGSSKYIPVTNEMLKAIKRAGLRQTVAIARSVRNESIARHSLMIGGSTDLEYNGIYYAGDLSGITTGTLPFWIQPFSKPDKEIRAKKNWQEKIDEITKEASKWDVGVVAGVPAWVQILFESIIKHYNVKSIHDVWPNLKVFIHGGVAFDPYRKNFEKLCSEPVYFYETYLASEGFVAYQSRLNSKGMKILLNNGIYFEFVPFNENNFNEEGILKNDSEILNIGQVQANTDYALLMSTCSGAWRYLIGDVVRFTSLKTLELKISGRTKHFLSLCGEHLSIDNMNRAIEMLSKEFGTGFNEFTVAGIPYQGMFAHHWFLATDENLNAETVKNKLDENLKKLNDDYRVERISALKEVIVELIPNSWFINYLKSKGKEGGQIKFPRVLRKEQYQEWLDFIKVERENQKH